MNISEAARRSGLSAKTIRYYETIDLINAPPRSENGYRQYRETDIELMRFLNRARQIGFGLGECSQLLELYRNSERHSADVKQLVLDKISEIDAKMENLNEMKQTLQRLAAQCAGNEGPECGIITSLADESSE